MAPEGAKDSEFLIYFLIYWNKCAFTCNQDEISSGDETRPGMKKFLFTREFHPGEKLHRISSPDET